jgi:two-component system, chemotaxis family, sensor histidine kinase and response regulator PixL
MSYAILIVDDTISLAEAIADMLRMEGYKVTHTTNGVEALRVLEHTLFDLIITDLRMPVMNGIEFIKHVRQRSEWAKVPIIVLSAQAGEENKLASQQAGANLFLIKPFDEHELLTAINQFLNDSNE